MKKQGFTYIITILIIAMIIISITFLLDSQKNNLIIIKNLEDKIQAEASAESMINIAMADENFQKTLKELYFKKSASLDPKGLDQVLADEKEYKLSLDNSIEKNGFKLRSYVKHKDIEASYSLYGSLINKIYTEEIPIINKNVVDYEDYKETVEVFNKIDYENFNNLMLDDQDYYIKKDGSNFIIYQLKEIQDENGIRIEENIVRSLSAEKSIYIKQGSGSLFVKDPIRLRGILDTNQLILDQNLSIDGIYLHRNEIISQGPKLKVDGLTVNMQESSENYIDASYNFSKFKAFSKMIDNFIKAKIYSIQVS